MDRTCLKQSQDDQVYLSTDEFQISALTFTAEFSRQLGTVQRSANSRSVLTNTTQYGTVFGINAASWKRSTNSNPQNTNLNLLIFCSDESNEKHFQCNLYQIQMS